MARLDHSLKIVTGPTIEPVQLNECKDHLRVTGTADDELIVNLIKAAREELERETRRGFLTQTWDYKLDNFPTGREYFELPLSPLQTINASTGIQYVDTDGNTQAWVSTGNWISDTAREPPHVRLRYNANWPSTREIDDAVTVRMIIGSTAADQLDQRVKQAILLRVDDWYCHRGSTVVGAASSATGAYEALVSGLRVGVYV